MVYSDQCYLSQCKCGGLKGYNPPPPIPGRTIFGPNDDRIRDYFKSGNMKVQLFPTSIEIKVEGIANADKVAAKEEIINLQITIGGQHYQARDGVSEGSVVGDGVVSEQQKVIQVIAGETAGSALEGGLKVAEVVGAVPKPLQAALAIVDLYDTITYLMKKNKEQVCNDNQKVNIPSTFSPLAATSTYIQSFNSNLKLCSDLSAKYKHIPFINTIKGRISEWHSYGTEGIQDSNRFFELSCWR